MSMIEIGKLYPICYIGDVELFPTEIEEYDEEGVCWCLYQSVDTKYNKWIIVG